MFDEIWKKQDEQKLQVLKSVDVTNDIKKSLEYINLQTIEKAFDKGLIEEDILEKARSGVYENTSENRKKGRVGQKYGGKSESELHDKINVVSSSEKYRYGEARSMDDEEFKSFSGVYGTKNNKWGYNMYSLNSFDSNEYKGVKLKDGEKLFRIDTERIRRVQKGVKPLVKVNLSKGLVYYLSEKGNQEDKPLFESKGDKITFMTLFK